MILGQIDHVWFKGTALGHGESCLAPIPTGAGLPQGSSLTGHAHAQLRSEPQQR